MNATVISAAWPQTREGRVIPQRRGGFGEPCFAEARDCSQSVRETGEAGAAAAAARVKHGEMAMSRGSSTCYVYMTMDACTCVLQHYRGLCTTIERENERFISHSGGVWTLGSDLT
jgi:hypothetical protein